MKPAASSLRLPSLSSAASPAGGTRRPEGFRGLELWHRRHSAAACLLFLAAAAPFAAGLEIGLGAQLTMLAAAVAVVGLPHGALDYHNARGALRGRFGRAWLPLFLAAYLGLAGLALAGWALAPGAMLVTFLAYSAWHFGSEDSLIGPGRGAFGTAVRVFRGLLPIALPSAFHPEAVSRAFNWLLPGGQAVEAATVEAVAAAALILSLVFLAGSWLARPRPASVGRLSRRSGSAPDAVHLEPREAYEIGAVCVLFVVAPPLLAFLLYFCGLHSLRQLLHASRDRDADRPSRAAGTILKLSLPLTLLTVALGWLAWIWLGRTGLDPDAALARVVFMGLSALTIPHMVLDSLEDRLAPS